MNISIYIGCNRKILPRIVALTAMSCRKYVAHIQNENFFEAILPVNCYNKENIVENG